MNPEIATFFNEIQITCQASWDMAFTWMMILATIGIVLLLIDVFIDLGGFSLLSSIIILFVCSMICAGYYQEYLGSKCPQNYVRHLIKLDINSNNEKRQIPEYIINHLGYNKQVEGK